MLLLVSTALAVFIGLVKAFIVTLGALIGSAAFLVFVAALVAMLANGLIEGLTAAWREAPAHSLH